MTYLAKPKIHHPSLPRNELGYTHRDYEGAISTLCAGCGHDSISSAIIQAFFELDVPPHRVAKLSGIGCSSKTPTYFLGDSHGFNSVHGRMPSVLTGAALANKDLIYLGVSGDGDSASIGLGQFAHVMRRGVNMVYIVENNGVYGLTKGQFSATADKGSKSKRGAINSDEPIDLAVLAYAGCHVRRARLLRGQGAARAADQGRCRAPRRGVHRRGEPVRRVQQHRSTKSYDYVREHNEAVNFSWTSSRRARSSRRATHRARCAASCCTTAGQSGFARWATTTIPRIAPLCWAISKARREAGEVVTGLLYLNAGSADMHDMIDTVEAPLNALGDADLIPVARRSRTVNAGRCAERHNATLRRCRASVLGRGPGGLRSAGPRAAAAAAGSAVRSPSRS